MMDEQRTRFEVMLEDMDRNVRVLTESTRAVAAALADMRHDFTRRFDEIDLKFVGMTIEIRDLKTEVSTLGGKVDNLETRVDRLEAKVDNLAVRVDRLEAFTTDAAPRLERLEAFATDAAPRLARIENHLRLNKPLPFREKTRTGPSKHPRRKPAKQS